MTRSLLNTLDSLEAVMPGVDFAQPAWLAVVPALWLAAWWIARGAIGGWQGGRQTAFLVVRCVLIAMLGITLARPSLRWSAKDVAVVVVRDMSHSVPHDQQQAVDAFIAASIGRREPGDRLGLITVARDATVQSIPSPGPARLDIAHIGGRDASNLQEGMRLAMAMLPGDAAGRILLVSDGNETSGSLMAAADAALASGVPIDVARIEYDRTGMIRVEDVLMPAWARENDTVRASVVIESGRQATGRLTVTLNGSPINLSAEGGPPWASVGLVPGRNVFTVPVRLAGSSVHRVEAIFEPLDSDRVADVPALLRATGVGFTGSRGRVLVLTEDESAHRTFLDAIEADDLIIENRPAAAAPRSLLELTAFDAVVLANQPASALPREMQDDLVRYVHDAGGGLLVLGGPESFGAGGWIGSPLAEALPIELDPPQKRQMPMGSLAIIIDRSASMASPVSGTSMTQQQAANEAAILGVLAMSPADEVAIIAFSDRTEVVVPLTRRSNPDSITRRIRSIGPGGGTDLFPALDAAAAELEASGAGVRHIIVLTDGQTAGDPAGGTRRAVSLRERGLTMSTVSIGDSANDELLDRMAALGGGRSYKVTSSDSIAVLPQIFIKEAQTLRRALIWEGPAFSPAPAMDGPSLRSLAAPLPPITGYVVTADRGGLSTVSLRGPENDPILAQWQHGLGRVTTFASDATARWCASWMTWEGLRPFWRQQLQWTMRPIGDPTARMHIETAGERASITVELFDDQGNWLNFAALQGRITNADSGTAEEVVLRQVAPGRYEANVDAVGAGVHLITLQHRSTESRRQGSLRGAIVRQSGAEFANPTPNDRLLLEVATRTGGRVHQLNPAGAELWVRDDLKMPSVRRVAWVAVALVAIAVFLLDVGLRRVALSTEQVRAWTAGLVAPVPTGAPATATRLAAARARAAATDSAPEHRSPPMAPDARSGATGERAAPKAPPISPTPPGPTPPGDSPRAAASQTPPPTPGDAGGVMDRLRAAKQRSSRE